MRRTPLALCVESLESRQHLSATAALAGGTLTITGNDQKDAIAVSLNASDGTQLIVTLGKQTTPYAVADVTRITVDAMGGNDKIMVNEKAGRVLIGMVVNGGAGNDVIVTGSGNDVVDGGAGNDKISGGGGDDYITGGEGNDALLGGDDNDQIDAGMGKDKVSGDAGEDNLDGGGGKDAIKAGDGADRLAVDDAQAKEVKLKGDGEITRYEVTPVADLPPQVTALLGEIETELPGFNVVRAETEMEAAHYSVYYRYREDPEVLKIVLKLVGDELDLVTRQVSLSEARPSARAAFDSDQPNSGLVSLFQHPGNLWDVRYRDADGNVLATTTDDIIWGIDDLESDQNDDGRRDSGHYDPND